MRQFFAIILASLTLFMNLGLTLSNHYCGGKLAESSLTFGRGDVGCGMENQDVPCEKPHHKNTISKRNCCENKFLEFQTEDEYNKTIIENSVIDFKFVAAFVITNLNLYSFKNVKKPDYLTSSPPILDHDIQVMNQSFLI